MFCMCSSPALAAYTRIPAPLLHRCLPHFPFLSYYCKSNNKYLKQNFEKKVDLPVRWGCRLGETLPLGCPLSLGLYRNCRGYFSWVEHLALCYYLGQRHWLHLRRSDRRRWFGCASLPLLALSLPRYAQRRSGCHCWGVLKLELVLGEVQRCCAFLYRA